MTERKPKPEGGFNYTYVSEEEHRVRYFTAVKISNEDIDRAVDDYFEGEVPDDFIPDYQEIADKLGEALAEYDTADTLHWVIDGIRTSEILQKEAIAKFEQKDETEEEEEQQEQEPTGYA